MAAFQELSLSVLPGAQVCWRFTVFCLNLHSGVAALVIPGHSVGSPDIIFRRHCERFSKHAGTELQSCFLVDSKLLWY